MTGLMACSGSRVVGERAKMTALMAGSSSRVLGEDQDDCPDG